MSRELPVIHVRLTLKIHNGMFTKFEELMEGPLLKSPCRHHSADLEPKAAYKVIFGPTRAPARAEFLDFRSKWPTLDIASAEPIRNRFTHPFLLDAQDRLKTVCYEVLADPKVRSDRKEVASLALDINGFMQPSESK